MDEPSRRRLERKSGSSSRSPSLSRRPSLKDKKAPGTIAKVKGKKSSASGSKKERWLLTRKTWRYMSETVGNLLPERQSAAPGTSTRRPSGPVEVVAAGPSSSAALFTSHSTDIPAGPCRPKSMPSTIPATGSAPGSKASSTVTSPTYGGIMSFPSHRPGVTPTGPGPGNMPRQGQGPHQMLVATEKFYPPSDDIPTLEKHFDAVCNKEKRFLLWTRSKPKGLSGPALRDQKPKKDPKKPGRRDSSGSIFDALRLQLGPGKENVGDYYSPTTEEEDDYDEYDDPEEVTLRERRKSSTASSTMSILSTGKSWNQGQLTFFRPVTTPSHGSESSYSMVLTQQGITICRNTGTQTDPFPEELLIRFRLQAVQEERKQQCLRQVSPDNQSDTTTVESPLSPVRLEAQKVSSPPPTTTASSPMSPTTSTEGGRESQEKLLETGSSTRPSISGQSESMATTKSGDTNTTATTTTTDKKSEESGYSSSISDTVMRYLRMVRKNSKADNKDTIDKFKTVNYDRSLRNIKSKNVTVEEALEHERNKEKAQQARLEQIHLEQQQQKLMLQAQKLGKPWPPDPPDTPAGAVAVAKIEACPPVESSEPPAKPVGKKKKQKGAQAQPQTSPTTSTAPVSPLDIPPPEGEKEGEKPTQTEAESVIDDSDIPPSSPPPPPPISPTSKDSPALSSPSSPTLQQEQEGALAKSVRCPLSSVGVQAGESLVRFLRNLNPNPLARKMSDFSSSCCSSESPGEVFSPRYSFATTVMSGSASDTEMFGGALQQAAMASAMAMSHTKSIRRQDAVHPQTPTAVVDSDAVSEFDDIFQGLKTGFFQKSQQQQQGGPLSSSWTGSASTSSTCTTAIKKSSSVQQMVSFEGEVGAAAMAAPPAVTTASSSSSYSLSQLFHYPSKSMRNRDVSGGGGGVPSPAATSTPGTPTTSSMGGSSGGLMKSFFGSTPFSSTFGLKLGGQGSLRKPTSTTSLTITTNTGSDSISGRGGNAPPPTTSSSPNLLSLIQSSAASAGSGFTSFFSSRSGGGGGGGGNGSSVTSTSASRGGGGDSQQVRVSSSSAASSSGELRAQETGAPLYSPLYPRSSLPTSGASSGGGRGVTGLGLGAHLHHRHPSTTQHRHHYHVPFTSTGASGVTGTTAGGGGFMAKGLSDFLFSHGHHASGSGKSSPAALSHVDLYLSPSGVMQKSKSSSSVLPLYGSSGSVSGAPGASSSGAAHLRVSPSGSLGGGEAADGGGGGGTSPGETAASATNQPTSSGSSAGGRLISKSKFFKARSKSSTRVATSSSGSAICSWSPQGRCKWKSVTGKVVTLEGTNVLSLSDVERLTLQDVALEKLRALNLGVEVKIPKEKVGGQQKPKRRPYLIKKKALSTGFFESASKREDTKETTGGGSGLVFGISLSQCVANDRLRQMKATADWELSHHQQQQHQQAHHKRSQNGSRNSVSSVFELPKEDKVPDPLQPAQASSVPGIVSACINHLENYGLHTTGIFRVSTSLKRIRQLREDIDSGKEIQFGEDHSPHDVAALLKEFLRDLPEPLLCRDLYQAFLKTQKIRNRKLQLEAIQHLVQLLPVTNRDTLAVLLRFFSKVVANACETRSKTGELLPGNKMEGYSLATLIAPNILPCMPTEGAAVTASASSMDQNAALTKERRESIDLVNYMISNYNCIFEMTPELLHDVYLHLMDTNPEAIEGILRQRCGASDDGVDELETTSSVFEESEGGETVDPDDTITGSTRLYRRREEILHEGAGKGGVSDDARTRERHRGRRDDGGGAGAGSSMGMTSEMERQAQSGGESDSSVGTRSTSRWFRRSRGDAKGRTSSDSGSEKVKGRKRESSLFETKRASSLDSVNIQEPVVVAATSSPGHAPRASPRASAVIAGGTQDLMPSRPLSGSDQSLRVPEHLVAARRQSSPVLESSGIITASLKIPVPVPLNIDDTDIPYIEDENNAEATTPPHQLLHHFQHLGYPHHQQQLQQVLHQGYLQYPQQPQHPASTQQQKYPQSQYQPYHTQLQHPDLMASDVTVVRCRSMSTDSSVPLKTTSSSMNTTPISSPARQPSSEVSSPTGFSPPTSPPLYGTFPIEEMTARMLIGSAAASSSTPSTVTALSTSPSLHQFPGAITMITPSSTGTVHQYSSIPSTQAKDPLQESKSAGSTPVTRPKIEKPGTSTSTGVSSSTSTGRSAVLGTSSPHLSQKPMSSSGQGAIASLAVVTPKIGDKGTKSGTPSPQPPAVAPTTFSSSQSVPSVTPVSSSSSSTQQQPGISSSAVLVSSNEPKGLGKETKGANIGGLMKSKTADFDRLSTTKSSSGSIDSTESVTTSAGQPSPSSSTTSSVADSTTPVVSSSSQHQIYSIAPKMRLRSQENVLLKQQFLLRQQQQHQLGESSTARRERVSQKGRESADDSPPSSSMSSSVSLSSTTTATPAADHPLVSSTPIVTTEEICSQQPSTSGGGRAIIRRRLVGSQSTSAIGSTKMPLGGGASSTSIASPRVRSRESEASAGAASSSSQAQAPASGGSASTAASTSTTAATVSTGSSPSRWKRSEIIASRQQSQPPSDPETFV